VKKTLITVGTGRYLSVSCAWRNAQWLLHLHVPNFHTSSLEFFGQYKHASSWRE